MVAGLDPGSRRWNSRQRRARGVAPGAASSGADRADLALVFVTGDAYGHAHALLHAVRRVTGAPVVLGCDGVGVLTETREVEGEPAVAVLVVRSERLVVTPFLLEGQGERPELGTELAERIGATSPRADASSCCPTRSAATRRRS